jgi:hypothetical protein
MNYFGNVDWLAIVLATVASMALGMVWYVALGRQWLAATGKTQEQVRGGAGGRTSPIIWAAACQLVIAYFIALLTPMVMGETSPTSGALFGAQIWLGFIVTSMIINHRYQNQKWSLTVIDGGYLFGVMVVQGAVIGLFG